MFVTCKQHLYFFSCTAFLIAQKLAPLILIYNHTNKEKASAIDSSQGSHLIWVF